MSSFTINNPPTPGDVAFLLRHMTYNDLRGLARDLCNTASSRADPAEELGGFELTSCVDWQELLADWAEAQQ